MWYIADGLSRLEINETLFEETDKKFLGIMECFAKKPQIQMSSIP
jgi:hypothetical protein